MCRPTRLQFRGRLIRLGEMSEDDSRYLEAAVNGVLVASIYAPNGNPQPGSKFDYKLAWLKRLTAHAAELWITGAPIVLAGDYNVVPTSSRHLPDEIMGP